MAVALGATTIDNQIGQSPLFGGVAIDRFLTIPESNWFQSGKLQLQLQILLDVTTNVANAKPNSERFLNPTQSQLGHWAITADDYVLDDGRIKYNKQAIIVNSPIIDISSTRADAPVRFSNTIAGKNGGFMARSGNAAICGKLTGIQVPEPAPISNDISLTFPLEQLTGDFVIGQLQFSQEDTIAPGVYQVSIDTNKFLFPDSIQLTVWQGQSVRVTWGIEIIEADSSAVATPNVGFVVGDVIIPPYGYGCAFGQPIPAPTNPPCVSQQLFYQPLPQGGFAPVLSCNIGTVP